MQKWCPQCPHKGECYCSPGYKGPAPVWLWKDKNRLKAVNAAKAENARKSGLKLESIAPPTKEALARNKERREAKAKEKEKAAAAAAAVTDGGNPGSATRATPAATAAAAAMPKASLDEWLAGLEELHAVACEDATATADGGSDDSASEASFASGESDDEGDLAGAWYVLIPLGPEPPDVVYAISDAYLEYNPATHFPGRFADEQAARAHCATIIAAGKPYSPFIGKSTSLTPADAPAPAPATSAPPPAPVSAPAPAPAAIAPAPTVAAGPPAAESWADNLRRTQAALETRALGEAPKPALTGNSTGTDSTAARIADGSTGRGSSALLTAGGDATVPAYRQSYRQSLPPPTPLPGAAAATSMPAAATHSAPPLPPPTPLATAPPTSSKMLAHFAASSPLPLTTAPVTSAAPPPVQSAAAPPPTSLMLAHFAASTPPAATLGAVAPIAPTAARAPPPPTPPPPPFPGFTSPGAPAPAPVVKRKRRASTAVPPPSTAPPPATAPTPVTARSPPSARFLQAAAAVGLVVTAMVYLVTRSRPFATAAAASVAGVAWKGHDDGYFDSLPTVDVAIGAVSRTWELIVEHGKSLLFMVVFFCLLYGARADVDAGAEPGGGQSRWPRFSPRLPSRIFVRPHGARHRRVRRPSLSTDRHHVAQRDRLLAD